MSKIPESFKDLPSYADLPNKRRYWPYEPGSAREGQGMTGLLTPTHIAECAASEIRTGERACITLPIQGVTYPLFGRPASKVDIHYIGYPSVFDDEVTYNPQSSSQWDGFRHHSQPVGYGFTPGLTDEDVAKMDETEQYLWYGGTTAAEIQAPGSTRIGLHHLRRGIVGRGVLLDYAEWAAKKGIKYSCYGERHAIPLKDLKQIVADYNITLKPGDILCVRIGATQEYSAMCDEERKALSEVRPVVGTGIEVTEETLEWIWNNHFTALVGDAIAFEAYPHLDQRLSVHNVCLAGWGIPLGEIFDLDELSELCKKHQRWSFFFNSVPTFVTGGVSSAPNAVAIF
ncbi:hypothetical protein BZA70DRAFT_291690 [Myxozyma melibiosi]|uniref:Cyclase n=1 Tax=Myxozyma melibiosi TaxID=54550 RepID=A0ABR1EZ50_9ASCO